MRVQEKMPLADTTADFLRPLSVQKGRHFAEKFATEDAGTFWYHDEKAIVSGIKLPFDLVHYIYFCSLIRPLISSNLSFCSLPPFILPSPPLPLSLPSVGATPPHLRLFR